VADPVQSQQAFEAKLERYVGLEEGPPFTCPDAVNEAMIRHWCEAMGDANPVYVDADAAGRSVHGGIVAPPSMLQVWEMRGFAMHDPALLPPNKQRELHGIFDAAGFTGVVATNAEQEFHRYLRPGDRITAHTLIESISERKTTALGTGYFIVTRTRMSDQYGEEVGTVSFRVLKFRPKQPSEDVDESTGSPSSSR
jgi:acyl dehydratase